MSKQRVALFLPNLAGGGAERSILNLGCGLAHKDLIVDLVLAKAEGKYLSEVPSSVNLVDLNSSSTMASMPTLAKYLKQERPDVIVSALDHANIVALWARQMSGTRVRSIVSIRNTRSLETGTSQSWKVKLETPLARLAYKGAEAIVAVSAGVADDASKVMKIPRASIQVIYNPVVSEDLLRKAQMPVEHPWFAKDQPPVVLAVGRLNQQKDYTTLLRAFAKVRSQMDARLMILGEGEERSSLEALASELEISQHVSMPGFAENPFAYMNKASLFVLSSRFEGLPGVLIQALACRVPVISTDCPSGPREVLLDGKYGPLVAVGDVNGLANATFESLQTHRPPAPDESWQRFTIDASTDEYIKVLLPQRNATASIRN